MQICSTCGAIAPTEGSQCEVCSASLHDKLSSPPTPDDRFWVQVRSQFQCRQCGHMSPINHIDVDGSFECMRCQLVQAVDASVWRDAMVLCHDVGDLAGPHPEGRARHPELSIGEGNPYADVGVSRTSIQLKIAETKKRDGVTLHRNLHLDASPGHPLCGKCHKPLEVDVGGVGAITTRCDDCDESASYQVDPNACNMHKGLAGTLAADARTDRQDAREASTAEGAPVAVQCPGCGANLPLAAKDQFVTCAFCGTASKIPTRLRSQLFRDIEAERWWMLFRGDSPTRKKLVGKAQQRAQKASKRKRAHIDAIVSHLYAALRERHGADVLDAIKADKPTKERLREAALEADVELDRQPTSKLSLPALWTTGTGSLDFDILVTHAMRQSYDPTKAKRASQRSSRASSTVSKRAPRQKEGRSQNNVIMLSAGVLGIVVLIVFFLVLDSGQKKQQEYDKLNEQREVRGRAAQAAAERRREEGLAQLEERRRKAAAPPQRSDASPVPGCSCTLPAGDPVALAAIVQHNATMAMGGTVKKQFGLRYFLDEGDQHFVLQSTGTAAPPAAHEGIALDLAMGCDADTVAIVGPTSVSGWSTRDGSLRWTTPFSTRFGVERFVEGELAIACHPTRVQAGVMSLVAEPGGPDMKLSVRLSDGKLL